MSTKLARDLPRVSAFLAGRGPVDPAVGVVTESLQVHFRTSDDLHVDERSHAHLRCDEMFIVLEGSLVIETEGQRHVIGPRQFCHFPAGRFHRIVAVTTPIEALAIRAPSVDDKIYR
jgi:mannose-6-phosphate isomerase-like protein (cupin superfamily)